MSGRFCHWINCRAKREHKACAQAYALVVLVVVCMIWFGMGSAQTIFAPSLLILTIRYVNTITGIESVDSQILEREGGSIELESVDDDAKARFEELLKR
uniref:Uncharacterized protein n=1 Tax=Candidatus Methanophaga sp. ANME-1 ERB7 TaxID=2759913 RepID=A0A7G9ZB81_9EURY|nr:hypothetical protein PKDJNKLE_00001 [Methanosarcinales archaeon ANME-1 ERB7]